MRSFQLNTPTLPLGDFLHVDGKETLFFPGSLQGGKNNVVNLTQFLKVRRQSSQCSLTTPKESKCS